MIMPSRAHASSSCKAGDAVTVTAIRNGLVCSESAGPRTTGLRLYRDGPVRLAAMTRTGDSARAGTFKEWAPAVLIWKVALYDIIHDIISL